MLKNPSQLSTAAVRRTLFSEISTRGYLDAGIYKCEVICINPSSEQELSISLISDIEAYAKHYNGNTDVQFVLTNEGPGINKFTIIYKFLNLISLLQFAQSLGFTNGIRSLRFSINMNSLIALI
tara:strand:+ start:1305 stop:1676 length:372 start_codon:yes stop_codon:yes gene_type:complete